MKTKEQGYAWLYSPRQYTKNINVFHLVYESLIYQWAKNLFTPQKLLNDLLYKISYLKNNMSWCLEYRLEQLNTLINKEYQYYQKYKQYFKNSNNISIRIGYIFQNSYQPLLQFYTKETVNQFYNVLTIKNLKSVCFYGPDWNTRGCLILLNGNLIDLTNKQELEQLLDHQLNHYFSNLEGNSISINKNIKPSKLFEKIAIKCGYDIQSEDFKQHILNNSEFNSMCADVCNILQNNNISYYTWLDLTTNQFLSSEKYLKLNVDLQNILLFSFACRLLDKEKWKILKQHVYIQLDKSKLNIVKSGKHLITDLLLKIK